MQPGEKMMMSDKQMKQHMAKGRPTQAKAMAGRKRKGMKKPTVMSGKY